MITMMAIYGFIGALITIGLLLKGLSKKWLVGIVIGVIVISCVLPETIQHLTWK